MAKAYTPTLKFGGEGSLCLSSLVAIYLPPTVRLSGSSLGPNGTSVCARVCLCVEINVHACVSGCACVTTAGSSLGSRGTSVSVCGDKCVWSMACGEIQNLYTSSIGDLLAIYWRSIGDPYWRSIGDPIICGVVCISF